MPGFVALKSHSLLDHRPFTSDQNTILDVLTYASINYALLLIPILWVESRAVVDHSTWYWFFWGYVLLINPIAIVVIWFKLRKSKWVLRFSPHPVREPWDYFFSQNEPAWVKIIKKDGAMVGGLWGDQSFASSHTDIESIYLQETWVIDDDGNFDRKINDSRGMLIYLNEISHLEFKKVEY